METSATTSGMEKNVLRIEKVETITRTDEKHPSALQPSAHNVLLNLLWK